MIGLLTNNICGSSLGEANQENVRNVAKEVQKKTRAYSFDAWVSREVSGDEVKTPIDDMIIRHDVRER